MKSNYRSYHLLFILMVALGGCLDTTSPTKLEDIVQSPLSFSEDYCQGSALTDSPFANSSSGGDGLTEPTSYIICTTAQFNNIGTNSAYWTKYFVLLRNINLNSLNSLTYNRIGSSTVAFTGVLNGNNKSILNFNYLSVNDYVGLLGSLGASGIVKNLNILNAAVTGSDFVGLIAGYNVGGEIRNVTISASYVQGTGDYIGGIVGHNSSGDIIDSSITLTGTITSVSGITYVGGIVGKMSNGKIENSWIKGRSISGSNYVGGITGHLDLSTQIRSSYATFTSSIGGASIVGGIAGYNDGTIYKSYCTAVGVSGINYIGGAVGANENGSVQESYATLSAAVSGTAYIGGLVGYNNKGLINNSRVTATSVSGSNNRVGGLVGQNVEGVVSASYAKVTTISAAQVTSNSYVGGLVGLTGNTVLLAGKIENSYAEVQTISGTGSYVGGLIGISYGSEIKSSYSKISSGISGVGYVGGLVGLNGSGPISSSYADIKNLTATGLGAGGFAGENTSGIITKSYAKSSGTITGVDYVGGFVGNDSGQIGESYALPTNITGTTNFVGGFAGRIFDTFLINVYVQSAGTITGDNTLGGFAGELDTSTILNSYAVWLTVNGTGTSGLIGGYGGNFIDSDVYNSYSSANVSGSSLVLDSTVGYFVGLADINSSFNYTYFDDLRVCTNLAGFGNCNNDEDDDGDIVYQYNEAPIAGSLASRSTYPMILWDFTNYWQENVSDYPTLR